MSIIKINDSVWHPCSMDIIEYKVTCIKQFENFNHYELKAVNNVGACGRIEVIIDEHKGKLRFVELVDEEDIEYSSGLQDFVEGNYYINEDEARLEFYKQQETLARINMEGKKRLFEESKKRHEQIGLLVNKLKSSIKTSK